MTTAHRILLTQIVPAAPTDLRADVRQLVRATRKLGAVVRKLLRTFRSDGVGPAFRRGLAQIPAATAPMFAFGEKYQVPNCSNHAFADPPTV